MTKHRPFFLKDRKNIFFELILSISLFLSVFVSDGFSLTKAVILISSSSNNESLSVEQILRNALSPPIVADYFLKVQNPNSYEVCDYNLKVDMSTFINDFSSNFKIYDLSDQEIPYCFEQADEKCSTEPSNIIWVKLPCIEANSEITLKIMETNEIGASDPNLVFILYDDFDQLDLDKWYVYDLDVTIVENSRIYFTGKSYISSKTVFEPSDVIVEAYSPEVENVQYRSLVDVSAFIDPHLYFNDSTAYAAIYTGNGQLTAGYRDYDNNWVWSYLGDPNPNVYQAKIESGTNEIVLCQRGVVCSSFTLDSYFLNSQIHAALYSVGYGGTSSDTSSVKTDWIRVRKIAQSNLTYTLEPNEN